jgi:RNA methyltransferase, TrmH family
MAQPVESLNVGVAAGISIYELRLKQVLAMIEDRIRSTLGRELNVAGVLVQKAMDAELKKVSALSSRQEVFMMVLKCDRRTQVHDMCRQFGVLESEAAEFLRPLIESELVDASGELRLTGKEEEVLAKLWPTVERTEARILADLTVEEAEVLTGQLRRIQETCVRIVQGG